MGMSAATLFGDTGDEGHEMWGVEEACNSVVQPTQRCALRVCTTPLLSVTELGESMR
jgi:hypothetical protein